jgi:uncharacterized protein GlcG (DUF336 family)
MKMIKLVIGLACLTIPYAVSAKSLSLDSALEGALAALQSCEKSGYKVSVAVVDMNGNQKVGLKGDGSTIHTKDTSYRKAYTLVTLGPIFKLKNGSEVADLVAKSPSKDAFLTVPNITPLSGSVGIFIDDEMVAAIGVGGAPGGAKDQECAQVGADKIMDRKIVDRD